MASRLTPDRDLPASTVHAPASVAAAAITTTTTATTQETVATASPRRRSWTGRLGPDRVVAVAVAGILLGASVISITGTRAAASTGGTTGDGPAPRIAVGGGTTGANDGTSTDGANGDGSTGSVEFGAPDPAGDPAIAHAPFAAIDFGDTQISASEEAQVEGPFIDDGTLVKPIAVDTVVPDGAALVKTYKVRSGDTLPEIATEFKVSPMTIVWANNLKSKTDIKKGQQLRIPPVTGLIVKIAATDTLDGIATRYGVDSTDILATNGLNDPNLVVGQVLVLPGAKGKSMTKPDVRPVTPRANSSVGGSVRPPASYTGGKFTWPVVGGGNYISQYFHYGHGGIDIAADYGSTVRAAAGGTVIYAGWKSNGGGYQVWVAHGSGLYTTYNHMSGVSVGRGQHVGRGQQVGRIGMTGNATGPHVHFEVWRGMVWDGGQRVNPLGYF